MYLKGLVLNGFKSFSSRVEIEFNKGIVGIIGPNGSGKSNILDAVLWVLGEQSYKSIRAKDSSDVIFSGGKNKKARSSASVSLIVDNVDRYFDIDSDEVVITRSINRDSVSTYSINNERVRLKDINELFMDTGIGKQAYSVIGQGKVERIISSSSVELRNIIDEAAGIKKAKFEKDEAFKKLKSVEDEIEKIEFVEENLKERVENLQEQSKKARIYNSYTDEINTLKYMVSEYNIEKTKTENEKINEDKKKYTDKKTNLLKKLEKLNIEIEKNEKRKKEIEDDLDSIFSSGRENEKAMKELKEKESSIFAKKTNFEIELKNKNIRKNELDNILKNLSNTLNEIEKEKNEIEKSLSETRKKLENLEEIQNKRIEKENSLKNQLEENKKNYHKLEVDKIKINADNEDLEKRISSAKKRVELVLKEYVVAKEKLEKLENNFSSDELYKKQEENNALKLSLKELNDRNSKNKIKYQDIKSEYISIKTRLDNLAQMGAAVLYVHNKSKDDKDVLGPLISMIEIDPKYQLASSIIAGYAFNDIVVTKDTVASKYIEMLKKDKVGQASFLPLNRLNSRKLDNTKYDGAIYARDIVKNIKNDSNIDRIIEHVFSNSLIVEDIKTGLKLKNVKDKIVSLSGDVINSSGRITGGFINKKIDETLVKRERMSKLLEMKDEIVNIIKEDDKKIEELDKNISENDSYITELKEKYSEYKIKKSNLSRELDTYTFELDENKEFITKKSDDVLKNKEALITIDKNLKLNKVSKDNIEKEIEDLAKEKNYSEELSQIKLENAVFVEKYSNIKEKYYEKKEEHNRLNTEYKDILEFVNNKDEIYSNIENEEKLIKDEILNLSKTNVSNQDRIENLTKENVTISNNNTAYLKEKNEIELELMDTNNRIDRLEENFEKNLQIYNQNVAMLSELEVFKERILNHLNYNKIENDTMLSLSYKKININEKSRSNLGEVNLTAIDEYSEENKKYENLVHEKFDLNRSKEQILDLIKEIDEDIIRKFNLAIENISKNFTYMCYELLHKAKGNIRILDENDPINTGIELSVKYKNKPEQSLSLLSGGEKSMLAVAFIMSIFMFKPSPFTFFDEVEAALDENNTKKLISLLKQFDSSQFILITHNKETMKGADRLYGVTMKKDVGESLIVSVDI